MKTVKDILKETYGYEVTGYRFTESTMLGESKYLLEVNFRAMTDNNLMVPVEGVQPLRVELEETVSMMVSESEPRPIFTGRGRARYVLLPGPKTSAILEAIGKSA